MSRTYGLAALCLGVLGVMGACRPSPQDTSASRPTRRVVSLHDVTTELVVALGAANQLVGVGKSVDLPANIEQAVAGVPRLTNAEALLSARPDVLLGLEVVASEEPALVEAVRKQGAKVYLPRPASFEALYGMVREVGERLESQAAAETLVAQLRQRVESLTARAERPVRVFVYDCCDPAFTAGGGTLFNELLSRAGGVNLFADVPAEWTNVSWEEVLARRPELVVVTTYGDDAAEGTKKKREALKAFPGLASLPVVELPLGLALGGIRSVDGLQRIRSAIAELPRG